MATRKTKAIADRPKLWNPDRITPIITSTGLAIGSAWAPTPTHEMTEEELWIQNILLKPGIPMPSGSLVDSAFRASALLIFCVLLYIRARYW